MARKVSISAADALRQRKKMTSHNTKVVLDSKGNAHMYLFGNRIAVMTTENRLFITTAGWDTSTTRGRLREIGNVVVGRTMGTLSINSKPWDGSWVEVVDASPVVMVSPNEPPANSDY